MAIKSEKDLPPSARSVWLNAMTAYERKNYGYAIHLAQAALKEVPDFLAARQLARKSAVAKSGGKKTFLGITVSGGGFSTMKLQGLLKKDPAAAMDAIEKVLENEPYSPQANQALKEAALAMNMVEVAAYALETIVEGNPKDTKTLHELAKLYFEHDDPEKAVKVYERIVAIAPHDLAAIKGGKDASARASMKKGGWDQTENYRDLIKDKDIAEALEQQNRVVKDEDTINNLLFELGKQVDIDPENIDKWLRIAELYEQKEDAEKAIEAYVWVNHLTKGSDPAVTRKLGKLKLQQIDTQVAAIEKLVTEAAPGSEEASRHQAQIEELKRQRAEIDLGDARERVDRNPTDLMARFELGDVLVRAGYFSEALPELQKAQANPSVRLKAMNLMAQCYIAKNMNDMAAGILTRAADEIGVMDALKKNILYNLGLVYEKMENKIKSIECFKQIYEVDYGYRDVAQRVESSYEG